ncbi:hypothetical protein BGZ65_002906 [Modicella reniformis]|uniref:Uncharacterized protein n=1 Tax=Modicella reniformis TaxID=1440133 RepID=A0A9P6IMW9_9FUNG|nr:hypothetical protein BGZ65_002906 [Modicella reniformis]
MTAEPILDTQSDEETALSLINRAQVYELPASYTFPSALQDRGSPSSPNDQERRCYRIHLETIEIQALQQRVHDILLKAIDRSMLLELPFDRNLSGYNSKTRTESRNAPLESPVVLDMSGLSAPDQVVSDIPSATTSSSDNNSMLLIPTKEWLRMSGRIRFWRAESHRIKAAQREVILDELLNDRWRSVSSATISTPPPSSGSLIAGKIPPSSLPSSAPSSGASSPTSPRSPTMSQATAASLLRPSPFKQPFQEHQLDSLVHFIAQYGEEPSASSILRGLFDLIRRQLTQVKVLSWTFDRANLTEQKPEVTTAFLDLIARLGLELVALNEGQQLHQVLDKDITSNSIVEPSSTSESSTPLNGTTSSSTSESTVTGAVSQKAASTTTIHQNISTELTWTFGPKVDDRRLEYWVHNVQQATLPVLKMDEHSLLPSTASFANGSSAFISLHSSSNSKSQAQKQNPIPLATRRRFLYDRNTTPAGSIQFLTILANPPTLLSPGYPEDNVVVRDRSFVLISSTYVYDGSSTTSGQFTERVKKDVIHLARWATTCGGRLDWIWAWLFSSFQKTRHGSTAAAGNRRPRPNDENV